MKKVILKTIPAAAAVILACTTPAKKACVECSGSNALLEHSVTYSLQGTKSEAQHGHLFLEGKEIPDCFTLISTGEKSYLFNTRTHIWGKDGYFPSENKKPGYVESAIEIDKEKIIKGWYAGKEKFKGTPCFWLYVEWQNGSAFVAPVRIWDMAAESALRKIDRMTVAAPVVK